MIVDGTGTILIPGNSGRCCDECGYLTCCTDKYHPEVCLTCTDPYYPNARKKFAFF